MNVSNTPTTPTKTMGGATPGTKLPATGTSAGAVAGKPGVDPTKQANARLAQAQFQIQGLAQRSRWLKMLVYGPPGTGKTELLATSVDVEEMGDVLLLDAESGDMTIADSPRINNADLISTIRVNSFQQVAHIRDFLKVHCLLRDAETPEADSKLRALESRFTGIPAADIETPRRFRTVIIDSLSEVEAYCNYSILGVDTDVILNKDEMEVSGWPEFRKNHEMMKLTCRAYRDLPMHVLFSCAAQWTQDEHKKFHYSPQMTGKLASQVQGFMDIVGFLMTGNPTPEKAAPRRLYVQPVGGLIKFDAKNRRPIFKEAYFDDPKMINIMQETGLLKKS